MNAFTGPECAELHPSSVKTPDASVPPIRRPVDSLLRDTASRRPNGNLDRRTTDAFSRRRPVGGGERPVTPPVPRRSEGTVAGEPGRVGLAAEAGAVCQTRPLPESLRTPCGTLRTYVRKRVKVDGCADP